MALQTTFGRAMAGAAPGTPGPEFGFRESYLNDEGAAINAGIAVCLKSEGKCENVDSAADVIAGIVLNVAVQDVDGLENDEYAPDGAMVTVQSEGPAYVWCEQSVTPLDPVYVRHTVTTTEKLGAFRKDSDSGKARLVPGARFITSGSTTTPPMVWFSKAANSNVAPSAALADLTFGTNITAATANGALTDSSATNPTDAQFNELAKEVGTRLNAFGAVLRAHGFLLP